MYPHHQSRLFQFLKLSVFKLFLLFLLGIVLVSFLFAQESFLSADPNLGKQLFEKKGCQNCHAIRGEGGEVGPDFGWNEFFGNAFDLAAALWNHSPIMSEIMEQMHIARAQFTEDEMAQVMSFLYFQRYYKKTGNVLKGKKLLTEKGCLNCHSVHGKGGKIARQLDKLPEYISPLFMAESMWNHGPDMMNKMKELRIKWPKFNEEEIVDLTNYLRILRMESPSAEVYMKAGNPASGKELLASKGCLRCHSVNGQGGEIGPDLMDLNFNKSVTEIAGMMWNHGEKMMENMRKVKMDWPEFQGSEIADLISYLYYLHFLEQNGNAGKGKKLFNNRGCANCHEQESQIPAPKVVDMKSIDTPIKMVQVMWNHAPNMQKRMQEFNVEWPQFNRSEMQDLFAFFNSLKGFKEKP
ncbi:MAG: c-type cytochrome [bacterium]